jgi:hypothetical protein
MSLTEAATAVMTEAASETGAPAMGSAMTAATVAAEATAKTAALAVSIAVPPTAVAARGAVEAILATVASGETAVAGCFSPGFPGAFAPGPGAWPPPAASTASEAAWAALAFPLGLGTLGRSTLLSCRQLFPPVLSLALGLGSSLVFLALGSPWTFEFSIALGSTLGFLALEGPVRNEAAGLFAGAKASLGRSLELPFGLWSILVIRALVLAPEGTELPEATGSEAEAASGRGPFLVGAARRRFLIFVAILRLRHTRPAEATKPARIAVPVLEAIETARPILLDQLGS